MTTPGEAPEVMTYGLVFNMPLVSERLVMVEADTVEVQDDAVIFTLDGKFVSLASLDHLMYCYERDSGAEVPV